MTAHHRLLRSVILVCLAFLVISSCGVLKLSHCQDEEGSLVVEVVDETIHVVRTDEWGKEIFRLVILKTGGIREIIVSQITYAEDAGGWIVSDDSNQTWGSDPLGEPLIRNLGEYATLTFFSKYRVHSLSFVTNITVSRTGLILISSSMKAEEDEPALDITSWGFLFPASIFAGSKAYVNLEGTVQAVNLPAQRQGTPEHNLTGLFAISERPVYWMDFSKPSEGITLVNLDPSVFLHYSISDQRWGSYQGFLALYQHMNRGGPGFNAMREGEVKTSHVALYIHGAAGYENALSMIDLLVDLGSAMSGARRGLESYNDAGARALALEALGKAKSGFDKIVIGDVTSASGDLDQASDLLKGAEDAERTGAIVRDLVLAAVPLTAIVVLVVILKIRRRK